MRQFFKRTDYDAGGVAMICGELGLSECAAATAWHFLKNPPFPNIWVGVSVEDQRTADERIPLLLETPAAIRWVDWIVVGGESGPGARPFNIEFARDVIEQCKAAGPRVFVKQLGAYVISRNDTGFEGDTPQSWPMDTRVEDETSEVYQGAPVRIRLKDRKGGDWSEWPSDLHVREYPD